MGTISDTPSGASGDHRGRIGKALFYIALADVAILVVFLAIGKILFDQMGRIQKAQSSPFFFGVSEVLCIMGFLLAAVAHLVLPKNSRLKTPTSTFTIFLAVGLVLSFIFVPSIIFSSPEYFSARSKVSRVKTDMRSMATALEAYYQEHHSYPPSTLDPAKQVPFKSNVSLPTFSIGTGSLTTPVAYIVSLPTDAMPDSTATSASAFAYWNAGNKGWILLSPGPDGEFNVDFPTLQEIYDPTQNKPAPGLVARMYDPTNGIVSGGDILRVR